ncbi:hypothetical protein GL58_17320 [Comamonas testosteroni]|jgi:hypothetical protein|uniref:DUF3325 domain-containing protein n=1 Tax=Comamonas testosteroni TaxID=285 RepID=A0A0L7MCY9_COMTE|nr:DUF3325 domain-containing protein [Comamonas testosteroni]KOC19785.1 hypothetical protein GL58_17320 [Comamonas testosteroni]KWT74745.1 hypothetical protein APV28_0109 [Comamonas testosteroni]
MREAIFLGAALITSLIGMGWLSLAMDTHWQQVRSEPISPSTTVRLRILGALLLTSSLGFCLAADHASMAMLVWVMGLAASALAIAFTLTWRPTWLKVLTQAIQP